MYNMTCLSSWSFPLPALHYYRALSHARPRAACGSWWLSGVGVKATQGAHVCIIYCALTDRITRRELVPLCHARNLSSTAKGHGQSRPPWAMHGQSQRQRCCNRHNCCWMESSSSSAPPPARQPSPRTVIPHNHAVASVLSREAARCGYPRFLERQACDG
jgi:hypothetical protein